MLDGSFDQQANRGLLYEVSGDKCGVTKMIAMILNATKDPLPLLANIGN